MPPLPPPLPRPPPAPRNGPNPHCQAAAMQAAAALAAEPMPSSFLPVYQAQTPPPVMSMAPVVQQSQGSWDGQGWWQHAVPMDSSMPPISQMLIREADAWRALLQLHGTVLNLTRSLASATTTEAEKAELRFDEPREASEQRETSYIASISQLCSQCELLASEAIKIRGLRKSKHQAETQTLKEVLRTHADEALGMGDILARNSAMQMASATSELRQAAQAMRTQVQQARALLSAASEWRTALPETAPAGLEFVMGYRSNEDGKEHLEIRPVSQVLEHVYQRGNLTDDNLMTALLEGPLRETEAPSQRTFARRSAEKQLRHDLLAETEPT